MRDGLKINNIKRLGNNLKSLTVIGENKNVEIRKLGNIESFFEYDNFLDFINKGKIENEYLFKTNVSLILNGDVDDIVEFSFYILAIDKNKDISFNNDTDMNNLKSSYNFGLYPYIEDENFGAEGLLGDESLGNIKVNYGKSLILENFNKEQLLDGVLEFLYDLYKIT